jgi:hypothetical protein
MLFPLSCLFFRKTFYISSIAAFFSEKRVFKKPGDFSGGGGVNSFYFYMAIPRKFAVGCDFRPPGCLFCIDKKYYNSKKKTMEPALGSNSHFNHSKTKRRR